MRRLLVAAACFTLAAAVVAPSALAQFAPVAPESPNAEGIRRSYLFITILIGPTSGYLSELTPAAWLSALGVFAAFGAISLAFWAWFRFRPRPSHEGGPAL